MPRTKVGNGLPGRQACPAAKSMPTRPAIWRRLAALRGRSYRRSNSRRASTPPAESDRWLSDRCEISRHSAPRPRSKRRGGVGLRSRRISRAAPPPSMNRSPPGVADRQPRRQVAVGRVQVDRQRVGLGRGRVEADVDDADLGLVAGARRRRGHRRGARTSSARRPRRRRVVVAQRVERPELDHRLALRRLAHAVHRVDRVHLVGEGAAGVGQHRVALARVRDADRLAALREQVDHRRAAEQQVRRADGLQHARLVGIRAQAVQREVQSELRAPTCAQHAGSGRSTKLNFSGKAKYSVSSR